MLRCATYIKKSKQNLILKKKEKLKIYAQRPGSGLYEFMLSGHNNYIKNTSSFKLLCTTTPVVIYCRATRGFIKLLCIRAALPPHTIVLQCFSQRFQLLRLSLQDIRMLFAINQVSERSDFSCLCLPAAPSLKCNITANHRYVKFVRFRRI